MIKAITVTNYLGESIRLELAKPEETGFIVKSIDGLGPVKADVHLMELATNDGAIDNSARLNSRNIVLSLGFMDFPEKGITIEDIRHKTYQYFPIKQTVTLLIETDKRIATTSGRVESNSPNIFDQNEGCQISILCPSSFFQTDSISETIFYGTEPMFEFAFNDEKSKTPSLQMGEIKNQIERTLFYDGEAEIGITIKIHATGDVSGLKIYDLKKRLVMSINDSKLITLVGSGIQNGDDITISTIKGSKSIILTRNGEVINILNVLNTPIPWFQLSKGDNVFAYTCESGSYNVEFKIENGIIYEGL